MEKKNNNSKKLPGFYIALCCCVIAIGAVGFIAQNREAQSTNTPTITEETFEPMQVVTLEPETEETIIPKEPETVDTADTSEPAMEEYMIDNPDVEAASVVVNAQESNEFANPLAEMTVKYGFSVDTLKYNEVYGDWRTHNGVDLDAPVGCSVNAICDGTVKSVTESSYGKTVIIEHPNGFESVYSQLGEISVNTGDTVTQGAVIATVGESKGENIKEPHLHFELHKDGKPVNSEEY